MNVGLIPSPAGSLVHNGSVPVDRTEPSLMLVLLEGMAERTSVAIVTPRGLGYTESFWRRCSKGMSTSGRLLVDLFVDMERLGEFRKSVRYAEGDR